MRIRVLCDTCTVLMLIRIAPSMFADTRYGCYTIGAVHREFKRSQKFKDKYPWRKKYLEYVRITPRASPEHDDLETYFEAISIKIRSGTINQLNGELFDLSYVDQRVLAWSLVMQIPVCTSDAEIVAFGRQEFSGLFKGYVSALAVVNGWIRSGIVKWIGTLHSYLEDWKRNDEPPQPKYQKQRFRQLTGRKYPGS